LIKRKPGFSGKIFWSLEIPFKTGFTVCPNARKCPAKEVWEVHDETNFSPVYQIFRTQILYSFPEFPLIQSVPKIQLSNNAASSYRLITKVISELEFHAAE